MLYDLQWKMDVQCFVPSPLHCLVTDSLPGLMQQTVFVAHDYALRCCAEQCVTNRCNLPADLFSLLPLCWRDDYCDYVQRLFCAFRARLIWMKSSWSEDLSFDHVCVDKEVNLLLLNSNNWRCLKWSWTMSNNKNKKADRRTGIMQDHLVWQQRMETCRKKVVCHWTTF